MSVSFSNALRSRLNVSYFGVFVFYPLYLKNYIIQMQFSLDNNVWNQILQSVCYFSFLMHYIFSPLYFLLFFSLSFFLCFFLHLLFTIVFSAARFWEPFISSSPIFNCSKCGRPYKTKYTLRRHERLECGLPALYKCRLCDYRAKHKHSVKQHFEGVHEKKNKFPLEVQINEWSILSNITTSIDCVIELNQMYS